MPNFEAEIMKFKTKYVENESLRKQMDTRLENYQVYMQQSLYTDSGVSEDLVVCYHGGDIPVYFYSAALQKPGKQEMRRVFRHLIKFFVVMEQKLQHWKPNKDYIFVFINTGAGSNAYSDFREMFLSLTLDHFLHLREFIVVRPSLYRWVEAYWPQDALRSHLKQMTTYKGDCRQLCEYLKISQQDFVDIIPQAVFKTQFPELKPRKLSLEDHRVNVDGQLLSENDKKLRKQFEVVIKSMLTLKPGKQTFFLADYQLNQFDIPVVLDVLVFYFRKHPEGLREEGLFRKSVSIDEENETLGELINKNYDCLLTISNPHIIANLIKRFFSNLKVPIFPYQQFQTLMHDQGVNDKKQHLKSVIDSLPRLNFMALMFVLEFLIRDVIVQSPHNKMTAQNIAICFAPCFLRAEVASTADMIYASKCSMVCKLLLEQFEYLFGDEAHRKHLFRQVEAEKHRKFQSDISEQVKMERSRSSRNSGNRDSSSRKSRKRSKNRKSSLANSQKEKTLSDHICNHQTQQVPIPTFLEHASQPYHKSYFKLQASSLKSSTFKKESHIQKDQPVHEEKDQEFQNLVFEATESPQESNNRFSSRHS